MNTDAQVIKGSVTPVSNFLVKSYRWIFSKGYVQGIFWIVLVNLTSNANDIFMRFLGERIEPEQIAFFRFFFAGFILLPIMLYKGKQTFRTGRPVLHIIRALMGFLAITFWCKGVTLVPLAVVSTIALTVPLFVLPLACLILKEKVGLQRTLATLFGSLGICIMIIPSDGIGQIFENGTSFGVIILMVAAILFALSDILNKFMVNHEGTLAMLFYFALGTTLAGLIPAMYVWITPTIYELFILFLLGFGGNFILYCLLKAFRATEVSALAPYRYLELIFAVSFGYLLFGEIPGVNNFIGAAIIIPATLSIAYYEVRKQKSD